LHAPGAGKGQQSLQAGEGGVKLFRLKTLATDAYMKHHIAKGNALGDVQCPLHLIERFLAMHGLELGQVDHCLAAAVPPLEVAVHRGVQGAQFELVVGEPGGEFADLGGVGVVKVLPGAEDLHRRQASLFHLLQDSGRQLPVNEQVGGKGPVHHWPQ